LNGGADAMLALGDMYFYGLGARVDYSKSRKWYKSAVAQSSTVAMSKLGQLYFHGLDTAQDFQRAQYYFELAGRDKDSESWCSLGCIYYTMSDYEAVLECFENGHRSGSRHAAYLLGMMYYCGFGVEENQRKAKELVENAALQGDRASISALDIWSRRERSS